MSTHEHQDNQPLSPELAALDASVGRLAAEDAAHAPAGLEDRVFATSRLAIAPVPRDIAPVATKVDRLAAAEQASGRPELEAQAFELSREAVASGRYVDPATLGAGSTLSLVGEGERPPRVVVRKRSLAWALRIAAAIALAGGTLAIWQYGWSTPSQDKDAVAVLPKPQTADQLVAKISDEMDVLFEVIGTDHTMSSVDSRDAESEHDTTWVDNLFSKESL